MPDFADDIVDGWVGGHGYNIEVSEDRIVDELKAAIRERCVEKPPGPTRLTEGGEATVNKDTGVVHIAAGKGIVNGEPVSWEASEQTTGPTRVIKGGEATVNKRKPRTRATRDTMDALVGELDPLTASMEDLIRKRFSGEPRGRKHVQFHCLSCGASVDGTRCLHCGSAREPGDEDGR